jgi:hypothetical protein
VNSVKPTETILSPDIWRTQRAAHEDRADALVKAREVRARQGEQDPIEDFLYTYYPFRLSALRRWTPGVGYACAEGEELLSDAHFQKGSDGRVRVIAMNAGDVRRITFIRDLCLAVSTRPAFFKCYGLHEWAMVYEQADHRRHSQWPLRLGAKGTDEVVKSMPVCCTHYDAFRFFTPTARPLNHSNPDLAGRIKNEQPGCVHVTMDLYKWTMKSMPWVSSDLATECYSLAHEARSIDMRASPYDFSSVGLEPICIETEAGRLQYESAQRHLAKKAEPIRQRLVDVLNFGLTLNSR